MIEVRIPKEVREYQEKWLMGMTKRQLFCCLLALLVNVPLYLYIKQFIGDELAGWLIIITAAPFALLGFYRCNGIPCEKFILHVFEFYTTEQKRKYVTKNTYVWIKAEYEREENSLNVKSKKKGKKNQIR